MAPMSARPFQPRSDSESHPLQPQGLEHLSSGLPAAFARSPQKGDEGGGGEPPEFVAIVDAVEVASGGRTLEGKSRQQALRAFLTCPRGFQVVAQRAIREGQNPCGLLTWALGRGQHEKAERAAE